jgi:hypothetical protein
MFLIGTDQITVYIFAIEQKKVNSQSKNSILETSSSLLLASNQNFTSREFSEIEVTNPLVSSKAKSRSKSQDEAPEHFDETKSREEQWALAGKKADQKSSETG